MSDLLTLAEAAERRGCSVQSIRHAIADGRLIAYESPSGERHVWADEVDRMDTPRHVNTSSGEQILAADDVTGDDEALLAALDADERRLMAYCFAYTLSRARLHIRDVHIVARLQRRFYRISRKSPPPSEEAP